MSFNNTDPAPQPGMAKKVATFLASQPGMDRKAATFYENLTSRGKMDVQSILAPPNLRTPAPPKYPKYLTIT